MWLLVSLLLIRDSIGVALPGWQDPRGPRSTFSPSALLAGRDGATGGTTRPKATARLQQL
jgi:hypothetical protein